LLINLRCFTIKDCKTDILALGFTNAGAASVKHGTGNIGNEKFAIPVGLQKVVRQEAGPTPNLQDPRCAKLREMPCQACRHMNLQICMIGIILCPRRKGRGDARFMDR